MQTHESIAQQVAELSSEYADLSDRLSEMKAELDNRGAQATDTSPLMRIKKALKKLRKEMTRLEVQLGIASTQVMRMRASAHLDQNNDIPSFGRENPEEYGHDY